MKTNNQGKLKIVTIGGGTGQYNFLEELAKRDDLEVTAIVAMADSGSSTGVLRDELGVLPPGDVRQALIALSDSSKILRKLFTYRFTEGGLKGHSFGNLFLSAAEKATGSFEKGVEELAKLLHTRGSVIASSLKPFHILAWLHNGEVVFGEGNIDKINTEKIQKVSLDKKAAANPKALKALKDADYIFYCPGTFYCSIVPNLLLGGFASALKKTSAEKVFVGNIITVAEKTISEYVSDFNTYAEADVINTVVYNTKHTSLDKKVVKRYMEEGGTFTELGDTEALAQYKLIGKNFIKRNKDENYIRHDAKKVINSVIGNAQK